MSKHTPGPWKNTGRCDEKIVATSRTNGADLVVCEFNGNFEACMVDEHRANARLIAACPELLEALKEALADCDDHNGENRVCQSTVNKMRDIINQIEGE